MRLYVYVAIVLALLGVGFAGGWNVRAWKSDHDNAERVRREIAQQQANAFTAASVSTQYETERAQRETQTRVVTKEVTRVVEKPVYRNVCIDADGLRLIAATLSGAAPAGEPSGPMPAASAPN